MQMNEITKGELLDLIGHIKENYEGLDFGVHYNITQTENNCEFKVDSSDLWLVIKETELFRGIGEDNTQKVWVLIRLFGNKVLGCTTYDSFDLAFDSANEVFCEVLFEEYENHYIGD